MSNKDLIKIKRPDKDKKFNNSEKFKNVVMSIVFAIAIWLMVVYINDPSITITIKDVDVRFTGETELKEDGFVLTGKNELPQMSVSVSGKRSDLMDYMNNIYIKVNIAGVSEVGEHEFAAEAELPTTKLSLEKGGSTRVTLNVEKLEKKSIQILTKQTGSNKEFLIKSEIDDDYVEISGAESEIAQVAYGIASVDVSDINNASEGEYAYAMYDKSNSLLAQNETIEAQKAVVHVRNTPYMKVSLPVIPELSPELAEHYMIDTSKTISEPAVVEVGINDEFKGEGVGVNIDRLTSSETEFYLKSTEGLYIPYEKSVVKVKPVILNKQIKQMTVKVSAVNVPEGMTADFAQETEVSVECADDVAAENVKAEIDLSGLSAGSYQVPVVISGDKVIPATNVKLDVTIK